MKAFLLALQFLTVVTVRSDLEAGAEGLGRSRAWYGPVGLILGLALAGLAWLMDGRLPTPPAAALLTLAWGLATRFLHLDGLADTADALVHITSRERALAIMKDSHLGSFGACALVCILVIKFAALSSLYGTRLTDALIVAPCLARAAAACMAALLPPARGEGLGAAVAGPGGLGAELAGGLLALTVAGLAAGPAGLAAGLAVLGLGAAAGWWFRRRLGGVTGDTLGALIETAEALSLAVLCAL